MMPPKIDSIEYLTKLKNDGYKIYILSNITADTYEYIKENFSFIKIVDGCICSCFENISKPDKEIFAKLLDKYNIIPCETIFIDDTKANIYISELLGLNGVLFENLDQVKKDVSKLIEKYVN